MATAVVLLLPASAFAALPNVYSCARCTEKILALTFDDGPHPRYTAEILAILEEYNARATFFTVGENAKRYPELLRKEAEAGHEIGNHTYSHLKMGKTSLPLLRSELLETEAVIQEASGVRPHLFRPPEGVCSKETAMLAAEMDYAVILWTVDTRDWAHTPLPKIEQTVLDGVQSGDIILFHDFIGKDSPTPQALRHLLPKLIARGYRFVTVSELLATLSAPSGDTDR